MKIIRSLLIAGSVSMFVACGNLEKKSEQNPYVAMLALALLSDQVNSDQVNIEITGSWTSNFNESITIANKTWVNGTSVWTLHEFDNQSNVLYFQNPADAQYFPSKYGRTVWTELQNNEFYYCTIVFGKDTLDEAKNDATQADSTDPANGGCGGFSWSKLTRK